MVAYGFKDRFVPKIKARTKTQTIRAHRTGRSRHARAGETLQLYNRMRRPDCNLIMTARCDGVFDIKIDFVQTQVTLDAPLYVLGGRVNVFPGDERFDGRSDAHLRAFARKDGFEDWPDLVAFWREEHGAIDRFEGVLIRWAA